MKNKRVKSAILVSISSVKVPGKVAVGLYQTVSTVALLLFCTRFFAVLRKALMTRERLFCTHIAPFVCYLIIGLDWIDLVRILFQFIQRSTFTII